MRNWLNRFFAGRRGPDALCGVLFLVGLVLSWIAWFTRSQILGWLVYLPWALALVRMFSTNLEKRYQENHRFLGLWERICRGARRFWSRLRSGRPQPRSRDAKAERTVSGTARPAPEPDTAYHHFLCPGCGQKLRVPRGRGMVEVTCPKCSMKFEEKA